MKKLAIVMIIAALCILPVIASAQSVQGKYNMIASGSCIHSENGYDPETVINPVLTVITAKSPGIVYAGTTVMDGTWNFDTKKVTYTNYATVTPPPTGGISGGIRVFYFEDVDFTYEVNGQDIIISSQGLDLIGTISSNKDVITLLSANTVQDFGITPYWQTICNTVRTLIKVRR
jgi:hypothetical protein